MSGGANGAGSTSSTGGSSSDDFLNRMEAVLKKASEDMAKTTEVTVPEKTKQDSARSNRV